LFIYCFTVTALGSAVESLLSSVPVLRLATHLLFMWGWKNVHVGLEQAVPNLQSVRFVEALRKDDGENGFDAGGMEGVVGMKEEEEEEGK